MTDPAWVDEKAKQLNKPKGADNAPTVEPGKQSKRPKKSKSRKKVSKKVRESTGG